MSGKHVFLINNVSLKITRINWIFLWRLSIQNHSKSSITEKRRNKTKYLTWNSIRLKFVKKTSMPNPAKSLGYIKCHSSSSPRPVKSPISSIRPQFIKRLVIVIYFFETEIRDAVIINYWLLLYSYSTGKNGSQIIGLTLI